MKNDISFIISVTGAVVSAAAFIFARLGAADSRGRSEGGIKADISHIREGVDEIKSRLSLLETRWASIAERVAVLEDRIERGDDSNR